MIRQVAQVLQTRALLSVSDKAGLLELATALVEMLPLASQPALALLEAMLCYDPAARLSPREALSHPWLAASGRLVSPFATTLCL